MRSISSMVANTEPGWVWGTPSTYTATAGGNARAKKSGPTLRIFTVAEAGLFWPSCKLASSF